EVCNSFKNVISQITKINKEYMSVSFIYRYIYNEADELDKSWRWIIGRDQTMQIPLNDFVQNQNTVYYTLINGKDTVVFYNDKEEMAKLDKYYLSSRDE